LETRRFTRRRGEALHPDREPLDTLDRLRRTIGEYNFAGQYQQSPAPLGGGLVKVEWFKRYRRNELPGRFDRIVQSWDTANKAFSVCTTWGVKGKELFLLAVFRQKLEYPALKRAVREQLGLLKATVALIEDKASGTQLIQELTKDGCHAVTRYQPTTDRIMRLHAQTALIENGFIYASPISWRGFGDHARRSGDVVMATLTASPAARLRAETLRFKGYLRRWDLGSRQVQRRAGPLGDLDSFRESLIGLGRHLNGFLRPVRGALCLAGMFAPAAVSASPAPSASPDAAFSASAPTTASGCAPPDSTPVSLFAASFEAASAPTCGCAGSSATEADFPAVSSTSAPSVLTFKSTADAPSGFGSHWVPPFSPAAARFSIHRTASALLACVWALSPQAQICTGSARAAPAVFAASLT
jgi:predicted phage terminase large subunit-like protein